jgi:hypothetical protein
MASMSPLLPVLSKFALPSIVTDKLVLGNAGGPCIGRCDRQDMKKGKVNSSALLFSVPIAPAYPSCPISSHVYCLASSFRVPAP